MISCSDTDVFLLLLYYYEMICTNTIFRTTTHDVDISKAYHALGDTTCMALPGFHSFTGCDPTGKFHGYSKLSCWKTFVKRNPKVLAAFKNLGENTCEMIPKLVIDGIVEFVLDLYLSKRPEDISDISSFCVANIPHRFGNYHTYQDQFFQVQ